MICKRSRYVIQRHNELTDLEAGLSSKICSDVEVETLLQDISIEQLIRGANKAQGCLFMHVGRLTIDIL